MVRFMARISISPGCAYLARAKEPLLPSMHCCDVGRVAALILVVALTRIASARVRPLSGARLQGFGSAGLAQALTCSAAVTAASYATGKCIALGRDAVVARRETSASADK